MPPTHVTITDVVLRDGLQDEPVFVPVTDRIGIADALVSAGVTSIEAASFVNPKRVPQMAGAEQLIGQLPAASGVRYSALALNAKGVERAVAAGVREIVLVASASSAHSKANAGRSPADAIADLADVVSANPAVTFIAGISTAFVCPFEGDITPSVLLPIVRSFTDIGVTRVGLADTIGTATAEQVLVSLDALRTALPDIELGLHLHNAHGQAMGTVDASIDHIGISHFDAALGGYGGCPFAPGAHGNLATESLVIHLHARGISTGIDEPAIAEAVTCVKSALARAEPLSAAS